MFYGVAYLIGFVLFMCTQYVGALEEHDLSLGALQRFDYRGAAEILRYLADNSNPGAQAALAVLLKSGEVELDYSLPPRSLVRAIYAGGIATTPFAELRMSRDIGNFRLMTTEIQIIIQE